MKILKISTTLILFFLLTSCVSIHDKLQEDYYSILNLQLENEKQKIDSLYLFKPAPIQEFEKMKNQNKILSVFAETNLFSEIYFEQFNQFLKKKLILILIAKKIISKNRLNISNHWIPIK